MSCHNKLQQLCRKYLKKLYRKARDIGLDEFVERTITENENGRCTATVEQVNMLASLCGDDRIKREEIPNLLGLSYRKCNEQKIFRGLFRSASGKLINADLNGAIGILRKVVGERLWQIADRGVVETPSRIHFM